eukprot:TRINITY_DN90_c4_g1_i2.p1 TRINITY_DN90_c4_g1~~TRINITY_DN90_c4_g1_i2.p1  ORF type:complete len:940 (+),score=153.56 TRINITY_DN90_c4_g1_i2:44-2863(+)
MSSTKEVLFQVQDTCDKLESESKYVESLEFRVRALELCREEYGEMSEEAEEMYLNISHLNCVLSREHLSARNLTDASCYLRALENLTAHPLSHTTSNIRRLLHRGRMFDLYSVLKQLQGRPQCGLRYAEKAATIFLKLESKSDIPPCFLNLSVLSSNLGLHKPALQHAYNALHACHDLLTRGNTEIKNRVSLADIHPEEATRRKSKMGGCEKSVASDDLNLENMLFDDDIEIPESRKISDMLETTEKAYKEEEEAMLGHENGSENRDTYKARLYTRSNPGVSPSQGILNSMMHSELAHASELWSSLKQTYPRFSSILQLKHKVDIPVEVVIRSSFEHSSNPSIIDRLAVLAMTESGTAHIHPSSQDKISDSDNERPASGSLSRPSSGRMEKTVSFYRMIPNFKKKAEQVRLLRSRKTARTVALQRRSELLSEVQDDYSAAAHFAALRLQSWWRMLLAFAIARQHHIRSGELSRRQSMYAMGTTAAKLTAERVPSSGSLRRGTPVDTSKAMSSDGHQTPTTEPNTKSPSTSPLKTRRKKKPLTPAPAVPQKTNTPKEKLKKRATINNKIEKNAGPEYDEDLDSTAPKMLLAKAYSRIAAEQEHLGELEECIESYQLSLQTLKDSFGKSHPATRRCQKDLNTAIATRKRKQNENLSITPLLLQTSQRRKSQTTERHQAHVAASLFTRRTQVGASLSPPKRMRSANQFTFSYQSSYAADPTQPTSFAAPKSGAAGRSLRKHPHSHHINKGNKILHELSGSTSLGSDIILNNSSNNTTTATTAVNASHRPSKKLNTVKEAPKAEQVGITPVTNWVQKAHAPPRLAAKETGAACIDVDDDEGQDAHPAILSAIHQRQYNVVKAHDTWVRTALEGTSDLGLSTADIAFLSSTFNLSLTTRPLGSRRVSNRNSSVDPIDNIRQRMIYQKEEASAWLDQLKQNAASD